MSSVNQPSKFIQAIIPPLVRIVFRPKVYFKDGSIGNIVNIDEPTIIVSNHVAHTDGTIISYIFRKHKVHNLAAKDRFDQGGLMKWFLIKSGCIPIDRKTLSTDWLHSSVQVLKQDRANIAIFPEGMHGKNRKILPFHGGAAMIAAFTDSPIVMTYIDGGYKPFRRCKVVVSEPFKMAKPQQGLTSDYISEQSDALRNKMLELQKVICG